MQLGGVCSVTSNIRRQTCVQSLHAYVNWNCLSSRCCNVWCAPSSFLWEPRWALQGTIYSIFCFRGNTYNMQTNAGHSRFGVCNCACDSACDSACNIVWSSDDLHPNPWIHLSVAKKYRLFIWSGLNCKRALYKSGSFPKETGPLSELDKMYPHGYNIPTQHPSSHPHSS